MSKADNTTPLSSAVGRGGRGLDVSIEQEEHMGQASKPTILISCDSIKIDLYVTD